jgi:hypothetical protein
MVPAGRRGAGGGGRALATGLGPGRFGRRNVTTVKALIAGRGGAFPHSSRGLSIDREKRKFNNHYPNRMHSFAAGPLGPRRRAPRRVRRSRAATGRRRAHTVAHSCRESGETTPDAPLCCCDGTEGRHLDGSAPAGRGRRAAAFAVSRAVSRAAGRPRGLLARAVHGQCAEAALGGPETRRSPIPARRG